MIKVFVDESGDLGTKERFFVIALIVPRNSKRIQNIIKHHCLIYGHAESKASALSFQMKQDILQKLCSSDDHEISYIAVDKEHISSQKLFANKNLLYSYIFQLLIGPIIRRADDDMEILLDSHDTRIESAHSLADHIKINAYTEWNFSRNLSIRYVDSKSSKQVQMADLIANAIYSYYAYGKDTFYNMLRIKRSFNFPDL